MTDGLRTESAVDSVGKPFVVLRWGDEIGQLSPRGARTLGLHMLECAEAAEQDAALFRFARDRLKLPLTQIAGLLKDLRVHRSGIDGG